MDDILIATKCNENMMNSKNILKQNFKTKNQGKIEYFLSIEFTYEWKIDPRPSRQWRDAPV